MSDVAFPEKYYVENFPEYSNYGKILEIFRKNTMEIFGNFPEKYEIFLTIFPPHITMYCCLYE